MTIDTVLCGDRAPTPGWPEASIVPKLCAAPDQLARLSLVGPLALGLCRGDYSVGAVQTALRSNGHDPFDVAIVDLRSVDGDWHRLDVMLAAAAARAGAFGGIGPEQLKPVFSDPVSRRAVLRLPTPSYVAIPSVDRDVCAAADGCRACVDECPRAAYTWVQGRIEYRPDICEPCGRCVTACPVEAIGNPTVTPDLLAAEIGAITSQTEGPVGIALRCRRSTAPVAAPDWYPVELPCVSMATPTWLLAVLLLGAGSVAALPCTTTGCALGYDVRVLSNVDYCRTVLAELGMEPGRVSMTTAAKPLGQMEGPPPRDLFVPGGSALLAMAAATGATELEISDHAASPVAEVIISPDACTACTACAQACPTGALAYRQDDGYVEISFDGLACTACGQCVPRCPEAAAGAIRLERRTDLGVLSAGRSVLHRQQTLTCEQCGGPIAPVPMMERLSSILGDDPVMSVIGRVCVDCRGGAP